MQLSEDIRKKVLLFQQTEITEYHIYKRLAQRIKSQENAKILDQIAEDELRHYNGWKNIQTKKSSRAGSLCGFITSSAWYSVLPLA